MPDTTNKSTNAVNGWNEETFSFTSTFQLEIIAAMIQQPKVFEKIGLLVDSRYFEIKDYSLIFRAIQNFYDYYKGLPTKEALYEKVQAQGYWINNIDTNIIAQEPKLMPFIPEMKVVLAPILGLVDTDISIKAKTKEQLDAVGGKLAIEAQAVVMLERIGSN